MTQTAPLRSVIPFCCLLIVSGCPPAPEVAPTAGVTVAEVLFVDSVWAGHPVDFALLTQPPHQFVAYYNQDRTMTVAYRKLNDDQWQYQPLPERTGWDSHNYISMALDEWGHLHLSGDMHGDTLNYYRTEKPYDIGSIKQVLPMVGKNEARVTYPEFFYSPKGELVFTYRDGSSGRGNQIYNLYDATRKKWQRLLDTALVDGQGEMNAYLHGPVLGPDGYYHLVWVWRDTPDAATNHDLSYAKSRDLIHWEQSNGAPQSLPITFDNAEIVDPVPARGGMINGNTVIGFDRQQRPVVTYHKYDSRGNTQVYNARFERGNWKIYQATDWNFRWEFGGGGSIVAEVGVRPVEVSADGRLTQEFHTDSLGTSKFVLHPETLSPQRAVPVLPDAPDALYIVDSDFPGMEVRTHTEGKNTEPDSSWYMLRWETLSRNRDRPRKGPLPPASSLNLYKISPVAQPDE